jgi:hypothetical protein
MAASNTLSSSVVFAKEAEMARLEQEYAFLTRELEKETDKDARANIEMDQQLSSTTSRPAVAAAWRPLRTTLTWRRSCAASHQLHVT